VSRIVYVTAAATWTDFVALADHVSGYADDPGILAGR
jgi:hypothetical protein